MKQEGISRFARKDVKIFIYKFVLGEVSRVIFKLDQVVVAKLIKSRDRV
jgi:hypothetical protein